mgnify:CR=1 FL=1
MGEKKKIQIEEIHKEIDLIQSCITRMAQIHLWLRDGLYLFMQLY